jgi:hypothetical protein
MERYFREIDNSLSMSISLIDLKNQKLITIDKKDARTYPLATLKTPLEANGNIQAA